ncbi:MAG: MCE family protein [Kofleriaceae bacterium]|nr:MCE family protein [Kofleriaceae bacterium]MBP9171173.1 MCE family protein [Kofleriaceae bacterium]MBP9860427.1 MCE family protein [Kofleriaceae bacterium]
MSRVAQATTIALLVGLTGAASYGIYRVARPAAVEGRFHTYVYFRDASGLPIGSRVKIAGIVVGEIDSLAIENGQARIGLRLRDDIALWDDAYAEKRAASPLADSYLELSPGGPEPGEVPRARRRLRSGEPISLVRESATTDRVLRGLEQAIPRAIESVEVADRMAEEARQFVAGPLSEGLARADRHLDTGAISGPIEDVAAGAARLDDAVARAQARIRAGAPSVQAGLDRLVDQTEAARVRLAEAQSELAARMSEVRTDLDQADAYAAQASAALAELAEPDRDRQGTLARLIDDPTTADELADTTTSLAAAARDLDRLRATVGLRAEWNLVAGAPRFVVAAEVASRGDSFYLIEVEQGPWGELPVTTLVREPGGGYRRQVRISDGSRFTAQWGRRFGRWSVRAGLRESRFGVGVDATLGHGRLRLSLDAMESDFHRVPRLKVIAALEVFRTLYVLGGVDDALAPHGTLPIAAGPSQPRTLEDFQYGRDFVLGFELRFDDRDATALLRLYGALIATLLS